MRKLFCTATLCMYLVSAASAKESTEPENHYRTIVPYNSETVDNINKFVSMVTYVLSTFGCKDIRKRIDAVELNDISQGLEVALSCHSGMTAEEHDEAREFAKKLRIPYILKRP